jgi:hypothetical protein
MPAVPGNNRRALRRDCEPHQGEVLASLGTASGGSGTVPAPLLLLAA